MFSFARINVIGDVLNKLIIKLFRKYRHVNLVLADQAMVSGVNFLTGILFARFLGIEEFGRFTLSWMAVLFINSIQMAMVSAPMMSIGPKQKDGEKATYYGVVIMQQICFACFSFISIYLGVKVATVFYPEWKISHLAIPLAAVTFFFQTQDFLRRYFFAVGNQVLALINDGISYLGQIILLCALFFTTTMDTTGVLLVIATTSAIAVLIGGFYLNDVTLDFKSFNTVFLRHWNFSKWLTAAAIMQWTSGNLFLVATGGIIGSTAVGAIKAAQNIMGVSHILFQGLENFVPVRASYYYSQHGVSGLLSFLKKVLLWGGGATAIIAVTAASFPDILLTLFYGDDYHGCGFILRWYAVIYFLIFIGLPLRTALRTFETTMPIFFAYVLMTFFSITAAKPLITCAGIIGSVLGILGTQIILLLTLSVAIYMNIKRAREI